MDRITALNEITLKLADNDAIALKYAQHLNVFINAIDPSKIGAEYEKAIACGDMSGACKHLAAYYRSKDRNTVAELSANGSFNQNSADRAIEGYAREVNIDWKFENGEINYLFDPTELNGPRNHEWLWQFNRHGAWANFARTYVATSDEKYAHAIEKEVLRWIAQTDIPEKWNAPGSAWRTIECGLRLLGAWQIAYDGLVRSDKVNDIAVLLMISSMYKQAKHLVAHPTGKNWLMMEMNGVYTFSSLFYELSDAESNRTIATNYLLDELKKQILPDGMHNELSPDYQSVVLNCSANFYSLACALGMQSEVPQEFVKLIKDTVNAAVDLSTPGFTQPRTNDCFTIPTNRFTKRAEMLFGKTPQWSYVNTVRAEGSAPDGEIASRFLPYAGFAAMRSDWGSDATYMCFDVGPLGAAHVHQDKLNINIYKGSEELIFDDGGGQYEISDARTYALSGYGHNTVLVDGFAQSRKGPQQVSEPIDCGWISNNEFDYAVGVYDDTFGPQFVKSATHKREVRFCKPDFFIVNDILDSIDGACHDFEVLFHLDTTKINSLDLYKNAVISDFGKKYDVVMIPLDCECAKATLKTVSAQTEPMMQGWYNGRNEAYLHEAITVSREVKDVNKYRFTTLIFPITKGQDMPSVEKIGASEFCIKFNGKSYTVDLNELNK